MIENRQNFRLRKQFEVTWSIPGQQEEGIARVMNISLSGMLFTTEKPFPIDHELKMRFFSSTIPSFPASGAIKWFRKINKPGIAYQCGVRFSWEAINNPAWKQWMEENILQLADIGDNQILRRYISTEQE